MNKSTLLNYVMAEENGKECLKDPHEEDWGSETCLSPPKTSTAHVPVGALGSIW
jgi:hypothetical protein